jgi:predicted ATPase
MGKHSTVQILGSSTLPVQTSELVGRRRELEEMQALLLREDVRVLTLTGAYGVGKTRLALQAAASLRGEFPQGVWFIDLFPVHEAEMILPTIMEVLGGRALGDEELAGVFQHWLADRKLLLVVDNFDHISGLAQALEVLLGAGQNVRIIAASSQPIGLTGEQVYPVHPLGLPEQQADVATLSQYESFQFFMNRMRIDPDGPPIPRELARGIAHLCILLNGLPLGLELAAARARSLPIEQVLSQLNDRLGDSPDEAAIIREVIGWSISLLGDEQQALLARLAVFLRGWRMDAAQAICSEGLSGDISAYMNQLLELRLIRRMDSADGSERFSMSRLIRRKGFEVLEQRGETARIIEKHIDYWVRWTEALSERLPGQYESHSPEAVDEEDCNIKVALERALDAGQPEPAIRLANHSWHWWAHHGLNREGARWMERAVGMGEALTPHLRATAINIQANLISFVPGQREQAHRLYSESLKIATEHQLKDRLSVSYNNLGILAQERGEYWEARSMFEEGLRQATPEQSYFQAMMLANLCELFSAQGEFDQAREAGQRCIATATEQDARVIAGYGRLVLGRSLLWQGEIKEGQAMLTQAAAELAQGDIRGWVAVAHTDLGLAALRLADLNTAQAHLFSALSILQEVIRVFDMLRALDITGMVLTADGRLPQAVEMFGAVESARARLHMPTYLIERPLIAEHIERLRGQTSEADFKRAWQRGAALALEPALAYALEVMGDR